MIDCKFVFKFSSGGTSDSLNQTYKVQSVPRTGDKVAFVSEDGSCQEASEVKDVIHYINPTKGTHEITVFYGGQTLNEQKT
jgi:hypothetical protein